MARPEYMSYGGAAAWQASEFSGSEWIDVLTQRQQRELEQAARALPEIEHEWLQVSPEEFAMPTLAPLLAGINKELETGRGFALLRGIELPPGDLGYAYRVKWALALALGEVIAQNADGELICAVQALDQADSKGIDTRGYVSNAALRFHCDGGDVASLLCVRQAPKGGYISLVSMIAVHNTMLRECPQHLEVLYRGLPMYMRKEGSIPNRLIPRQRLFIPGEGHLLGWIHFRLMELSYQDTGVAMPSDERAALDALEKIAECPEFKLSFRLQPGDMLLVHNYVCMHKRSGFVDHSDPAKKRLMLRLWYNHRGGRVEGVEPAENRAGSYGQVPYVIRRTLETEQ